MTGTLWGILFFAILWTALGIGQGEHIWNTRRSTVGWRVIHEAGIFNQASPGRLQGRWARELGQQMGDEIDRLAREATVGDIVVGVDSDAITYKDFVNGVRVLEANNVPRLAIPRSTTYADYETPRWHVDEAPVVSEDRLREMEMLGDWSQANRNATVTEQRFLRALDHAFPQFRTTDFPHFS